MLNIAAELFSMLRADSVRYCHWKSNATLSEALDGVGDLDLLVDAQSRVRFIAVIDKLGFKRSVRPGWLTTPGVEHYFGLDLTSGKLLHLHVYYKLVTGGGLVKKYHFPFEETLLSSSSLVGEVSVLNDDYELALLVIRKLLEHCHLPEYFLLRREYVGMCREIEWLSKGDAVDRAAKRMNRLFPQIEAYEFAFLVQVLLKGSLFRRRIIASNLRKRLRSYQREGDWRVILRVHYIFWRRVIQKYVLRRKSQTLLSGGSVIAIIGPDASGKSSTIARLSHWLGRNFWVDVVHLGKPRAGVLTKVPQLFLPLLRSVFPQQRSSVIEIDRRNGAHRKAPLLYYVRRLIVAHDRRRMVARITRRAKKGALVICDRYPSANLGSADGPQLLLERPGEKMPKICRVMARGEKSIYQNMPKPDIVIQLKITPDKAMLRNNDRGKPAEPAEYLQFRHQQSIFVAASRVHVAINTDSPFAESLGKAQSVIWGAL